MRVGTFTDEDSSIFFMTHIATPDILIFNAVAGKSSKATSAITISRIDSETDDDKVFRPRVICLRSTAVSILIVPFYDSRMPFRFAGLVSLLYLSVFGWRL